MDDDGGDEREGEAGDERPEGELDRGGKTFPHESERGLVQTVRVAEVADDDPAEEVEVLHDDRPVEPECGVEGVDVGTAGVVGEEECTGGAGEATEDEADRDHEEDRGAGQGEAAEEEGEHGGDATACNGYTKLM
ncbi:hypothetical protein QE392_001167 [Microbacterium proteolyticum]|nr:hypothetical protein [Microbacterium proteolyticum]MDQ1169363.1 hypothetical protein [Microbacterium proteolyticum]